MRVSISWAKRNLSRLIKAVESGEDVTLCRRGVPVADLIVRQDAARRTSRNRKFGTLKGRIRIIDPNWWKPMNEKQVLRFLAGRY